MQQAPLPVVVNRSGGTAARLGDKLAGLLTDHFAAVGLEVELHLAEAGAVDSVLAKVAGAPVVAVGGGDGTLGRAAGRLAKAGSALAILPLGTRNHLAGQLGIPADLREAAGIVAGGKRTRIDLARAGDRVFVNNASVGIYSRLVRVRDAVSGPKWLGNLRAAWHVLHHLRARPIRMTIDGRDLGVDTPLLFIGNNRYALDQGLVGMRESLSDGVLCLYAVAARSVPQLMAMAARTLVGRADPQRDFSALEEGREARIHGIGTLDVAFDGEVERMDLPLDFAVMPLALEVVVPAA